MDTWHLTSGIVSIVSACCLSWMVLHPSIHEGLVVKLGLMVMIFSLLATGMLTLSHSIDWTAYWRSAFWLRVGICITCVGVVLRFTGSPLHRPSRRMTDWLRYHAEDHKHEVSHHGGPRGH